MHSVVRRLDISDECMLGLTFIYNIGSDRGAGTESQTMYSRVTELMVSLDSVVIIPLIQAFRNGSFSLRGWPFAPDMVAVQSYGAEEDPGSATDMEPWAAVADPSTVSRHSWGKRKFLLYTYSFSI
jgi:hypothetical protein